MRARALPEGPQRAGAIATGRVTGDSRCRDVRVRYVFLEEEEEKQLVGQVGVTPHSGDFFTV